MVNLFASKNELPFRHLLNSLDGATTHPKEFCGPIDEAIRTCEKKYLKKQIFDLSFNVLISRTDNCLCDRDIECLPDGDNIPLGGAGVNATFLSLWSASQMHSSSSVLKNEKKYV
ncbi:hypothetical protein AVEN_235940-1 [Araneus ventricosus]|uniref:Uncharacterized protein n=1 Tax=Araneus ventricosus TaxID=182803 RepID=A0A4Y2MTN3_ARAVE|nr:hypothetical protein AVEN_235940-1 [Araneus ventricosus]